ncbi:hypothetical protein L484_011018 [Morus notabilis]|uniref:Uncharacterized protein n=1 Tax=Morus notabilis TaxID=981085 RepID=W9R6L1_9ROSA|nr:hypothetical protein L484_011018 [Morus notabilis]
MSKLHYLEGQNASEKVFLAKHEIQSKRKFAERDPQVVGKSRRLPSKTSRKAHTKLKHEDYAIPQQPYMEGMR